jgi:AcrR family transcriptional regulator
MSCSRKLRSLRNKRDADAVGLAQNALMYDTVIPFPKMNVAVATREGRVSEIRYLPSSTALKAPTNAIAERAGVNISSLYQFFPNKEAIVAELQRRHIAQTHRKLVAALPRLAGQRSLRDALLLLVGAIVDEHRVAPALHRAIAEELPQSVKCPTEDEVSLRRQALNALRPFMKNVPDPEVAMEIGVVAARAVIHGAATHRPEVLGLHEFREEVVALLQGYLQRRASSARVEGVTQPRSKEDVGIN